MSQRRCQPYPGAPGMSLIEIVIVMALVGILLSLATPNYLQFVARAHRTDAVVQLLSTAACQERIHASRGSYDTRLCLPAAGSHYQLEYDTGEKGQSQLFTVSAHPIGVQTRDRCGALSLNQSGIRGVSAAGADILRCWSSR